MPDRKKVIEGLGRLSEWLFQQYQIVYDGDAPNYYDAYKTVDVAIDLLKEKEAVAPKVISGPHKVFTLGLCRECGTVVKLGDKYCNGCGRRLLWK